MGKIAKKYGYFGNISKKLFLNQLNFFIFLFIKLLHSNQIKTE